MADKPFAAAAARNAAPILDILRRELRDCREVLEIGSGTGQHAATFAAELSHLQWQTSDLDENHPGIQAWVDEAQLNNLHAPLSLDVRTARLEAASVDAVYSANTAHIMGIDAVEAMFTLVGAVLRPAGVFCLYGPFRLQGTLNTASNEQFDAGLRSRGQGMGIRDLETLDAFGARSGLVRRRLYAVPSNNYVAIWERRATDDGA
jgi:cyclopropane fatty-acyl-phospholipid synthase-like methyltransferase